MLKWTKTKKEMIKSQISLTGSFFIEKFGEYLKNREIEKEVEDEENIE